MNTITYTILVGEVQMAAKKRSFPSGARVRVSIGEGWYGAIVRQAFPEGSTSYAFPHYKVDIIGGDRNCAVKWERVSAS